jgi:dienelactone hydrolase
MARIPFGRALLCAQALFCLAGALPGQSSGPGPLATGLAVHAGQGQSFLTWNEVPSQATRYRIYRSPQAFTPATDLTQVDRLGEVDSQTTLNLRLTTLSGQVFTYVIQEGAAPLEANQGLFVYTIEQPGDAYYAVTTVSAGIEDTTLVPGINTLVAPINETPAPPRPVLQFSGPDFGTYVHWVSERDTPFAPAMAGFPGLAFNLRVSFGQALGTAPRPLLLQLHERGGSFLTVPPPSQPEAIMLAPDDWQRIPPFNTYWFGSNPDFPGPIGSTSPANADFTVRRVLHELDWATANFPVDPDRTLVAGISMGGAAAISLAYRYPDRFAAAAAIVPKFDWGCQANGCWSVPETGDQLWGALSLNLPSSDGVPTYDRLDTGFVAARSPADLTLTDALTPRPPILALCGRQDTVVGWQEKPLFFKQIQNLRHPAVFLWDDGTHSGPGSSAEGPWKPAFALLEAELWDYRRQGPRAAFTRFELDGDPGGGNPLVGDLIGSFNAPIQVEPQTFVDTPELHRVHVRLRNGSGLESAVQPSARADWTPRGLTQFQFNPPCAVRFENYRLSDGQLIQSELIKPDSQGLYTAPRVVLTQAGNRLVLRKTSSAPYGFQLGPPNQLDLEVSGPIQLGATPNFVLSGLDAGAVSPLLALSLAPANWPLLGGVVLIDETKLFQVLSAPSGAASASFALPLPQAPGLIGRQFFSQGFVASPLGPEGLLFSNGIEAQICP